MTHNIRYSILFLVLIISQFCFSQDATPEKYTKHNKSKFYIYWGGNRAHFTDSDIRFKGKGYDFTLNNVQAGDKPKGLHIDYFNPLRMTIPQTNFRIGYFLTDHYAISLGVDHMKYVMKPNQMSVISGYIGLHDSPYNGQYSNTPIILTPEFLQYEHTDGLNYVHAAVSRVDDIGQYFIKWNPDHFQLNLTEGIGAGVLYPKTNTTLMGKPRHDDFHISGFGLSANAGINITFLKHFFVQTEIKGGYINMQDVRTTNFTEDSASQDFFFLETNFVLGTIFRI